MEIDCPIRHHLQGGREQCELSRIRYFRLVIKSLHLVQVQNFLRCREIELHLRGNEDRRTHKHQSRIVQGILPIRTFQHHLEII
jgi:hypothetical protein